MKKYLFIILLACSAAAQAQTLSNNYKYLIVPEKFSFFKKANQYNLNGLTKALFEGKGFTVYFDNDELPTEIATDRCKALTVDMQEKNTMFVTSLTLLLKDCKGTVVLKSKEGKSREKEYQPAYTAALRDAFDSFGDFRYAAGNAPAVAEQSAGVPTQEVKAAAAVASQPAAVQEKPSETLLYAQPINNGFKLVDTEPKIVMTLLKTSVADCFIANAGSTNGVVLKKNGDWFFEYYKNNLLVSEKLQIKF